MSLNRTSTDPTGRSISNHPSQRPFYPSNSAHPSPSRPAATASSTNSYKPPELAGGDFGAHRLAIGLGKPGGVTFGNCGLGSFEHLQLQRLGHCGQDGRSIRECLSSPATGLAMTFDTSNLQSNGEVEPPQTGA